MENHTAKHFVLQLGSLASLYLSLTFLLVLLFGVINSAIPDVADSYWQISNYGEGIRIGIAMLIVFFPTYLVLTRIVNQNRRRSKDTSYLGLTKWLIYLSLLVGGAVLLGNLVAVIVTFLEGELTLRFMLKALVVLMVTGSAFTYYLFDAKGYWLECESTSKICAGVTTVVVLGAIVAGFIYGGSPAEARERELDNVQIGDLQDMQWRIEDYYQTNDSLPKSLSEVYGEFNVPVAPENRADYRYLATSDTTYELCAYFAVNSFIKGSYTQPVGLERNYDWHYQHGDWCFEREIDDTYQQKYRVQDGQE